MRRLLARDSGAALVLPTEAPEPQPDRPPVPPPERIGPYRLLELLGEGGMGAVYRAERDDGLFDQIVAVKLISSQRLSPQSEARFAIERRALARLAHPNIARLLDGGVTPVGASYILMDYVDGEPIADYVRRCDPSDTAVVGLLVQVCEAVAEAHRKLVVHGDLKPSNILVAEAGPGRGGQARLLDFGVARLIDLAEAETARSPVTASYADPTRGQGDAPTTADDIFALGVVLRELVTRHGPAIGPQGPARAIPRDLEAIAAKATASAPADRYGSVDAMAEDLQRWLRKEPVAARPADPAYVASRLLARRPRIVVSALAAVGALAVTAVAMTALYVRAEADRREADRRFAQTRGMARYMLFDLFDDLNRTPGTIAIRRDLVETSRRYLGDLAASPRASADLKADVAMGYLRLAGVLGLYGGGNLGERDQGKAMLARAQEVLAHPPRDAARSAAWMHARGRLGLSRGFDVLVQGAGGKAAEPILVKAVADLSAAARLAPKDPEILADLWEARLNIADLKATANDSRGSQAILTQELAAYPSRAAVMASDEKTPLLLARTYKFLGTALYDQKDLAGAAAQYAHGVRVLEDENRRRPDRSRTIVELIDGWWNLATTLDELGRRDEALRLFNLAVDAGRARLPVDPESDTLRRATSLVELDRAALLARLGRRGEALADARGPLERWRALAQRRPDDVIAVRGYIAAIRPFADIERTLGMRVEACADYRDALARWNAFDLRFGVAPKLRETELPAIRKRLEACG